RPPEQPAENADREEEAFGARDPGGAIQRQPSRRHQAMDMGMMMQGLTPGMQDAEKPDLRAQMLGIMRNGLEGLGHGLKQQGIDHTGILQREWTERGGQGKDDMAVGPLQDLALPRRQPGGL